MLPTEDAIWVGAELSAALRPALLAVHAHRHGRQPLRAAPGAPDHRPPARPGVQLVLSRHGGRGFCHVDRRRAGPRWGNIGPAIDPALDHPRGRIERPARAGGRAGARRCGLRAGRARHDQHRHHPPGPRLSRRPARAHPPHRHAADYRRDAHHLRRPRRLHAARTSWSRIS